MHDIHFHTKYSACAHPDSEPEQYLECLKKQPLTVAGFSDHLWDSAVPGSSPWYQPQTVERLLPLKEKLRTAEIPGCTLLFGCETEYTGNGVISLHPDHAELFDYVLVPPHHFHMKGFVLPAGIQPGAELNKLFIQRFLDCCDIDFVYGLVHPFVPLGYMDSAAEILHAYKDSELEECFKAAAERNKSVEINLACLQSLAEKNAIQAYERLFITARECGCKFHTGSDAHDVQLFADNGLRRYGLEFAQRCGISLPENPFA